MTLVEGKMWDICHTHSSSLKDQHLNVNFSRHKPHGLPQMSVNAGDNDVFLKPTGDQVLNTFIDGGKFCQEEGKFLR